MGKARKKTFGYIKQKIWSRVQGWQEKLLSKAGKEILIKAVAQAIPTYAMSCFDITKGLCDELSTMIGRYWWSQQDKIHKIHWLSWEKVSRSKKRGGLGFRDLHLFNQAMLARQAWRLLTCPDTLCAKVLKAKYYPNNSLLQCQARGGISYSWRSILFGLDLLLEGIIWRVGNGSSINIWHDPWLPRGTTRRPITPRRNSLLTRVDELINPINGEWDEDLVKETFWEEDAAAILALPISEGEEDWLAWHYDNAGKFSVKSAYKLAVQTRDQRAGANASSSGTRANQAQPFEWQRIWQQQLPNKVNMFVWRFAHNSLPVRRNLKRRGVKTETICPLCARFDEDCGHLFFKCKQATECWRVLNLDQLRTKLMLCQSGREVLQMIWSLSPEEQRKVIVFLWRLWSARNKVNANEKRWSTADICSSVIYHLTEFEGLKKQKEPQESRPQVCWRPPDANMYKLNIDASFLSSSGRGGWGYVARDQHGAFLDGGAGNITHVSSALQAEAIAAWQGLQRAASVGMASVVLETDAANLGHALSSVDLDLSPDGGLFKRIRRFIVEHFDVCRISVRPRCCNKVADRLATYGCTAVPDGEREFWCRAPSFVTELVMGDTPEQSG